MDPFGMGCCPHGSLVVTFVFPISLQHPIENRVAAKESSIAFPVSIAEGGLGMDVAKGAAERSKEEDMEREVEPNDRISVGPNEVTVAGLVSYNDPRVGLGRFFNESGKRVFGTLFPSREPVQIIEICDGIVEVFGKVVPECGLS